MSLKSRKNKLVNDITAKVERKLVILLKDHFAEIETDFAEIKNEHNDLSNHVDELESEFRHEVHGIQGVIDDDLVSKNDLEDHLNYNISDYLSYNLSDFLVNEGLDIDEVLTKGDLDNLISELRELGETLGNIG